MRISTKTTIIYTVEFTNEEKIALCKEITETTPLDGNRPALRLLQMTLDNPEQLTAN